MGGEAFKRRLVYSVALIIMAKYNFALLFKSFTANVMKCTAHLKAKVKCVSVTMCSLVISPFSRDFIKNGNKTNQSISYVLTYLPCV